MKSNRIAISRLSDDARPERKPHSEPEGFKGAMTQHPIRSGKTMRYAATVILLVSWLVQLPAQAPATKPLEESRFEVTSIKSLPAGSNIGGYSPESSRFHGFMSAIELVSLAYQLPPLRVADGPPWMKTERFEVTGMISAPRQKGDLPIMLRHLLEDRFGLKVHPDRRPMPVNLLLLARSDGKLGPGLRQVNRNCSNDSPVLEDRCYGQEGIGNFAFRGWQWDRVLSTLERMSGRTVIDRTGLSGQFDMSLEWNPQLSRLPELIGTGPTLADLEARPILSTAVREQLGLKLEPGTEPVDVLVIDRIERPMPD